MINILIPLAGNLFFDDNKYLYPKPLIEIGGKTIIQLVIENLDTIKGEKQFIFVVNLSDCQKFHLDNILRLLTNGQCKIIKLENQTKGAAASCLMAIEHINNNQELIIANSDQLFNADLNGVLSDAKQKELNSFVICFESVHPRWSFVKLDDKGNVMETAEKRPISNHAIAGFYYFKQGAVFIEGAMESIRKEAHIDGIYYTSPILNELILSNHKVGMFKIKNEDYQTFYSQSQIENYSSNILKK